MDDYQEPLGERKKRPKGKKRFGIERHLNESASTFIKNMFKSGWHTYRFYHTEKARDDAFETLSRRGGFYYENFEYRKVNQ